LLLSVRKPYLGLAGRIAHAVFFWELFCCCERSKPNLWFLGVDGSMLPVLQFVLLGDGVLILG
jgi:hypothetical protein